MNQAPISGYNEVFLDPYQHTEDDRDGLWNIGFFTVQPLDPADSQRELHYTQLQGKHQLLHLFQGFIPSFTLKDYKEWKTSG
jgi:hypothetical protein